MTKIEIRREVKRINAMDNRISVGYRVFQIFNVIFMLFVMFLCVIPFWHVLMSSVSDAYSLNHATGIVWYPLGDFSLFAYKILLGYKQIWVGYRNTIMYCVGQALLTGGTSIIIGYMLSRKRWRYRYSLAMFMAITMFLGGGGLIPTYLLYKSLGLINNPLVQILPGAINMGNIILMRSAIQGVPDSLEESARIDGASELTVIFRVFLPLVKASFATVCMLIIFNKWNEWFNAFIYLPDEKWWPLQVVMRDILVEASSDAVKLSAATTGTAGAEELYSEVVNQASVMVATIPILCVYPFVQKYFEKGMKVGSVKG